MKWQIYVKKCILFLPETQHFLTVFLHAFQIRNGVGGNWVKIKLNKNKQENKQKIEKEIF